MKIKNKNKNKNKNIGLWTLMMKRTQCGLYVQAAFKNVSAILLFKGGRSMGLHLVVKEAYQGRGSALGICDLAQGGASPAKKETK
jgi:hypothetical protein